MARELDEQEYAAVFGNPRQERRRKMVMLRPSGEQAIRSGRLTRKDVEDFIARVRQDFLEAGGGLACNVSVDPTDGWEYFVFVMGPWSRDGRPLKRIGPTTTITALTRADLPGLPTSLRLWMSQYMDKIQRPSV
jgi:hypothetical protein